MASLAEYFQAFHKYAVENDLSASSRALYYTILGEFNARFWRSDKLSISVRDMQVLGGFLSSSVVDRAKTVLGTENIVKIQKLKNRRTQYELVEPQFWLRNKNKTLKEQARDSCNTPAEQLRDGGLVSYTRARAEDVKTERQEDFLAVAEVARAHAREGGEGTGETAKPTPEIKVEQKPVAKVSHSVLHHWIQATYSNPTELDEEGLAALEKEFGSEKVFWAIGEANRYKKQDRINLALVETVLKNSRKPQRERGEASSGNNNVKPKSTVKDYDWSKNRPDDLDKYDV